MGPRGQRPCGRPQRIGGRLAIGLAVAVLCALWVAPARAADPYPAGEKSPPQVQAQHFFSEPTTALPQAASSGGTVREARTAGSGSGALAFTGVHLLLLLLTALVAAAIGFVLWRAARHRPEPSNR